MGFWRSIKGTVRLKITAADPMDFLSKLYLQGISVAQVVHIDDLTIELEVIHQKQKYIQALARKQGVEFEIIAIATVC